MVTIATRQIYIQEKRAEIREILFYRSVFLSTRVLPRNVKIKIKL
jgi:hypothetical protein